MADKGAAEGGYESEGKGCRRCRDGNYALCCKAGCLQWTERKEYGERVSKLTGAEIEWWSTGAASDAAIVVVGVAILRDIAFADLARHGHIDGRTIKIPGTSMTGVPLRSDADRLCLRY